MAEFESKGLPGCGEARREGSGAELAAPKSSGGAQRVWRPSWLGYEPMGGDPENFYCPECRYRLDVFKGRVSGRWIAHHQRVWCYGRLAMCPNSLRDWVAEGPEAGVIRFELGSPAGEPQLLDYHHG